MVHAIASIQGIIRIEMRTRVSGVISSCHLDLLHRYYASAFLASLNLQGYIYSILAVKNIISWGSRGDIFAVSLKVDFPLSQVTDRQLIYNKYTNPAKK
jgi:hypothetical protein